MGVEQLGEESFEFESAALRRQVLQIDEAFSEVLRLGLRQPVGTGSIWRPFIRWSRSRIEEVAIQELGNREAEAWQERVQGIDFSARQGLVLAVSQGLV